MDLGLSPLRRELTDRARAFAEDVLLPFEDECEANDGLSERSLSTIRGAVIDWEFNAINHAIDDGGQGLDLFDQVLISEQWGRATGALWDVPWRPAVPLRHATAEQRERYLRPACAGTRRDAYAITEEHAGSDVTMVTTRADREGDAYILRGEKWHVTCGDVADFLLVHAHVDGDPALPTIFLVDVDQAGVRTVRTPRYMHTFVFAHPIIAFDDVQVGADAVLGAVGEGFALTKEWFVEERLMIGARTVGAASRALELSLAFARDRQQFGRPILDFQAIEFMLADMAAEVAAAKALLYRVAWQATQPATDPKRLHALAASAKLICSETAGRVADRAVQIFGGRGYMREQPVERLFRELRVDRIWEGTSEIQRTIIGNELSKRGAAIFVDWPPAVDASSDSAALSASPSPAAMDSGVRS